MKKLARISCIVLLLIMLGGIASAGIYAESRMLTDDFYIINETYREIAPGISDRRIVINNTEGTRQNILYVCEFDLKNESVGMRVGYPEYDPSEIRLDTTTNQAIATEKATGENVVVAMNGNFFSEGSGAVEGLMIMNGIRYSGGYGDLCFGCTADDELIVGRYSKKQPKLTESISGYYRLIEDGKVFHKRGEAHFKESHITTRNAVGVTKDGKAICLVMEGKCETSSPGINIYELEEIMLSLGCVDAILNDGGGSSTYAVQHPGSNELIVENDPTYGVERKVSATLMVTTTAELTGESSLSQCQKNGHTYIKVDGAVSCVHCNENGKIKDFTGLITDKKSGKKMFYINGAFQTGWTPVDNEMYYFNSKGLFESVTAKSTKDLECTANGYTIYRCEGVAAGDKNEFKLPAALTAPGHLYDSKNVCKRCGWKAVNFENCSVKPQKTVYEYTGKPIEPKVSVKSQGKSLSGYYDYKIVGYKNNVAAGTGEVYLSTDFHNGADLIGYSGGIKYREEPYVVTFKIQPAAVSGLKARTLGVDSVKLSWKQTPGAKGYRISKYNPAKGQFEIKKTINDPKIVNCTFKGLNPGQVHQYRVFAIARDADNKMIKSEARTVKTATNPVRVKNVKLTKANKINLKVKWSKNNCSGYQIRYASNKNFNKYKQVVVSGKNKTNIKITNLKRGQMYYVKVRAFTTVNNAKVFGKWSNAKVTKMK